jgi:hypothetical protein
MDIRRFLVECRSSRVLFIACLTVLISAGCDDSPTDPRDEYPFAFASAPVEEIFHNEVYTYTVETTGGSGEITYQAVEIPGWLDFDGASRSLSGVATADNLGSHAVRLSASDDATTVFQQFDVAVRLREVEGGSWSIQTPYDWPHDGQPWEGAHCVVYTDASSDIVKKFIADRVDVVFEDIKDRMGIVSESIFTYPAGADKIDVYINRFNDEYQGGYAYHGGAIMISPDSPFYQSSARWCITQVEHEIFHVVETLIEGSGYLISDVWFREGIADYYAGNDLLATLSEMEAWVAPRSSLPGGGNPIVIHTWNDFPEQVAAAETQGLWYPMFELAVRYLMDDRGLGKTYIDVKEMWQDAISTGRSFSEVFGSYMGISLETYESNCFVLITEFLSLVNTNQGRSAVLPLATLPEE